MGESDWLVQTRLKRTTKTKQSESLLWFDLQSVWQMLQRSAVQTHATCRIDESQVFCLRSEIFVNAISLNSECDSTCDMTRLFSWVFFLVISCQVQVPGPAPNFQAVVQTSTSVSLSWDKPLTGNGDIQNYKVYYMEKSLGNEKVDSLRLNLTL